MTWFPERLAVITLSLALVAGVARGQAPGPPPEGGEENWAPGEAREPRDEADEVDEVDGVDEAFEEAGDELTEAIAEGEDVEEAVDEAEAEMIEAARRMPRGAPDASMVRRSDRVRGEPTIEEREIPDYDKREDAQPSAGRRLLWIPRIAFFPLWVFTEFVLRRPLSALTRWAERRGAGGGGSPLDILTFDHGRLQVLPTLLIDFGNQPSVGFYVRWNGVGHEDHHLRLHVAFWGPDWIKGRFTTRWEPEHDRMRAELRVSAQRRGDGRFAGLGSEADPNRTGRFNLRQYEVLGSFEAEPWRQSFFHVALGFLDEAYGDDAFCCPTIEERVAEGAFSQLPPGYQDGFSIAHFDVDLSVDTRRDRGRGSSGVSVRFHNRFAVDVQDPDQRRWARYGGSFGLHWDMSGHAHIVSLVASAQVAQAIEGEVPFTQQVELSGTGPMRGFRQGSLVGDSGAVMTMRYQWPVWEWIDGTAHVGLGNVYDGVFDDFGLDSQRMSFGIGLGAVDELDHYFHFTLGWGTETIARGMQVETFRLAVGAEWQL